jgi:hypothetical protein
MTDQSIRSQMPGPADYQPTEKPGEEPHRQIFPSVNAIAIDSHCHSSFVFRRRHYLAISAPAIPIPPEAPLPGPGAYDLRDFSENEKKYMSSAAFVSNTSRWVIDTAFAEKQPGPASYMPHLPVKQSFNFNFERKWI